MQFADADHFVCTIKMEYGSKADTSHRNPPTMAVPYFITSLKPHPERRSDGRPLLECLRGLTFIQWAQFFSG